MHDEHRDEVPEEELEQQEGEPLPEREAMSVVSTGEDVLQPPVPLRGGEEL